MIRLERKKEKRQPLDEVGARMRAWGGSRQAGSLLGGYTQPKFMGGMGFRDIELFNLALLARQAWRLLQEPNSLSARILKSVYYPSCSILDAEIGSNPSQVWRSTIEGRDTLKLGLINRIGTGEAAEIWNDN